MRSFSELISFAKVVCSIKLWLKRSPIGLGIVNLTLSITRNFNHGDENYCIVLIFEIINDIAIIFLPLLR